MTKQDNSNLTAKVEIRKFFLELLPRPATVLECFAGEKRKLYYACYEKENVTALDLKPSRGTLIIDNKKFVGGYELTKYNYFDLDAYGSPYELLLNILYKKQNDPEPFVVICTDGIAQNLEYGSGSLLVKTIINNRSKIKIPFLHRHQEFIIKLMLKTLLEKYNVACPTARIIKAHSMTKPIFYYGLLLVPQNHKTHKKHH